MLQLGCEFYRANTHAYDYLKASNILLELSQNLSTGTSQNHEKLVYLYSRSQTRTRSVYVLLCNHVMYTENKTGDVTML
jgi:hypothetical protein